MKFENLACERAGDVLKVVLNRPTKLNSLSLGLLRDLRDCAEAIQRDRAMRAVLLTGAGRGFCAGADLTDPPPFRRAASRWASSWRAGCAASSIPWRRCGAACRCRWSWP